MDNLAYSMAELCHSKLIRDVGWKGIPVNYCMREVCILVIIFERRDLPVCRDFPTFLNQGLGPFHLGNSVRRYSKIQNWEILGQIFMKFLPK